VGVVVVIGQCLSCTTITTGVDDAIDILRVCMWRLQNLIVINAVVFII